MSKTFRIILIVILSGIALYSVTRIVMIQMAYSKADDIYDESRALRFHVAIETSAPLSSGAESVTTSQAEEYFPQADADIEGLQNTNPEVLGWLWIPDTTINYPLLRAADNWKYLNLSYNLQQTNSGSIFMDFRNSDVLSDDNTVIYGHNMKSGGMFGKLKDYAELEYLEDHPYVYIFTAARILKYRIFAAYETTSTSESYTRDFSGDISFDAFMTYISASAGENMTETPQTREPLLLLSTCTSGKRTERFVLHAVLVAEKPLV